MFTRQKIRKGEIICNYDGEVCTYKELKEREKKTCYILEFKFQEKLWGIDVTTEDCSIGRLINHSKKMQNIKPVLKVTEGKPLIRFIALRNIDKDDELIF